MLNKELKLRTLEYAIKTLNRHINSNRTHPKMKPIYEQEYLDLQEWKQQITTEK